MVVYSTLEGVNAITASMLGIDPASVNGEMTDAIGELTNLIAGSFRTRMAQRLPQAVADRAREHAVLGRTTALRDIAEQIVTFCRADSVTGQVLVLDGGAFFH